MFHAIVTADGKQTHISGNAVKVILASPHGALRITVSTVNGVQRYEIAQVDTSGQAAQAVASGEFEAWVVEPSLS